MGLYPNFVYPPIFGGINEPIRISSDMNELSAHCGQKGNEDNNRTVKSNLLSTKYKSSSNGRGEMKSINYLMVGLMIFSLSCATVPVKPISESDLADLKGKWKGTRYGLGYTDSNRNGNFQHNHPHLGGNYIL